MDTRDGRWVVKWWDRDTQQTRCLSLRTSDETEARERYAAFLVEGEAIFKPRGNDGITVSRTLDDYYTEHVCETDDAGKPNCADTERQAIAIRHLKNYFKDVLLSDVDIPMCRRYAAARREGSIGGDRFGHRRRGGNGTIRRELNVLVAAANHALRWKRTTQDKMPSIELPEAKTLGQDEEAPFYTKAELRRLIDAAEDELKWFIELAYWTGARRRSISELDRSQVSWERKRILLQKPDKKATKKRQPIVPILPEMERPLRALWDASEGRTRLFSNIDFYVRFKALCMAQGLADRAHPHLIRHSRATHLLQDGVSLYAVSRLLGDTMETIERVYGHHSHENLAEQIGGSNARADDHVAA
ncbi:integrase [Methyloceanibacter caenitepidi]|uniref:Integrase n=2 Tax=Methyloceanibacter caenitepidi TaxID=1384459 RepID=A0A0A8K027_9HYPH|nr:integrase [Methyloceanibacter caenitepidi]